MIKAADMSPRPPRGSRQRERTRVALLSAGQALFSARAVESVTVDEIVDAAEVAKGSFYNHFDDKVALADAVYERVQADVECHIFTANRDVVDAPARIARALCTVIRYALEHPERLLALLSLAERRTTAESPLNAGVSADVLQGLEQARLVGIGLETGVLMVIGTIHMTVRHVMSGDAKLPPPALAAAMAASLLRGLGVGHVEAEALARAAAELLEGKRA